MAWSGTVMAEVLVTGSGPRVAAKAMPGVASAMTGTAAATRRAVVPARTMRTMTTPRCDTRPSGGLTSTTSAVVRGHASAQVGQRKTDPSASTRGGPRAIADESLFRPSRRGSAQRGDHVVDRSGELRDVLGLDGREHRDAHLVATQLAVGLDVDDPVGAQRLGDRGRVDGVVEVDRADDLRPGRRVGDVGGRPARLLGPGV